MTIPAPRLDAPRSSTSLGWPLLLLLAALLPYGLMLADPPLWDANEPLYAEPPREALETGDWGAPPWNYKPWFVRPPLASWITMPFYAALGVSPFSERLPMALAAMATILSVASIGTRMGGRRVGLMAALVLSATPRFWLYSRQFAGDVYLGAFLTGAFALAAPTLLDRGGGRLRILAAHALVGLGVLIKGPVIVVLYAVPLFLVATLSRPRVPLRALRPWSGLGLILLLGVPWFAYMTHRYGFDYLKIFVGHHHMRRAVSDELGGRPWWFYVAVVLGDAQPWISLVPFAARRAWVARSRDPLTLLAWIGAAFPLVAFSFAVGKRNVYLLPCYPMLALCLSPFLLDVLDGIRPRVAAGVGTVCAVIGVVAVVLLMMAAPHVPPDIAQGSWPFRILCGVAAVGLAVAAFRRSGRGVVVGLLAALLACEVTSALLLPALGRYFPVPRLAQRLVEESKKGDVAVVYATRIHSLMYYARRPTVVAHGPAELIAFIPPGGRVLAIVPEESYEEVRAIPGLEVTEIERAPFFQFHFGRNVLGQGKSWEDRILVAARRRD